MSAVPTTPSYSKANEAATSRSSSPVDDTTKVESGLLSEEERRRKEKALVWKIDKTLVPFLT